MSEFEQYDNESTKNVGAVAVRNVLTRLGYPASKHVAVVCALTGLSKPQAGRRVNGKSQWSIDDFAAFCTKLGVDFVEALEVANEQQLLEATLKIGPSSLPCRIRISSGSVLGSEYYATNIDGGWVVLRGQPTADSSAVTRLVIDLKESASMPVIAVFDDSTEACDSMCDILQMHGFQGRPYYEFESLIQDVRAGAEFDGFVLDWLVADGHVGKELELLSRQFPSVPIVVLTGMDPGAGNGTSDLASVVSRTGAIYFSKPAVTSILVAALKPKAVAHHKKRSGGV
jgi:hypothetical protein